MTVPLSPATPEAALDALVRGNASSFTLEEAVQTIQPFCPGDSPEQLERTVRAVLNEDCSVFTASGNDSLFFTRQAFFKDKIFRLTRFETECKQGVIIPGGRLTAFFHPSIPVSETTLQLEDGTKLPSRALELSIEEAAAYYNLLGAEEMFHEFEAESVNNTPVLNAGDPGGKLTLSVFSTEPLGDPEALVFRVLDWAEGIFEVKSAPSADFSKAPEWLPVLEKSLCQVFDAEGFFPEIPEQIALALFGAPEVLEMSEPFESDRLLAASDLIEIVLSGSRTHLWRNDEEKPADIRENQLPDGVLVSAGTTDSAEDILEELKCPLTVTEILATMRDELYSGGDQFQRVYDRLFTPWHLEFADDAQEAVFVNYLEALWEDICEDYNRSVDQETGRVRHFALGINNERLRWLAHIARSESEPCTRQLEVLEEIGELSGTVLKLIGALNEPVQVQDEMQADQLIEALTQFADRFDHLKQQYNSHPHDHGHAE